MPAADIAPLPDRTQRRIVAVLALTQVFGGIGMGGVLSLGALLAEQLSGSAAFSGMAATMSTLGAAIVAVPLARLALRRGRRVSLAAGSLIAAAGAVLAIVSAALGTFPLLLLALALLGVGGATNLQARFAATDLASPSTRGRDLSTVVWATTIGAVLGPNLFAPGETVGAALGLPPLTGAFAFAAVAQVGAAALYAFALTPDPLLTALTRRDPAVEVPPRRSAFSILRSNPGALFAVATIALSHATMVSMMSMAPVHLRDHGIALTIVGFTISLHIAGMYALSPVFGYLSDRWGRLPVILCGQGLLLISLALSWLGEASPFTMGAALVLLGLGWSASVISASALVSDSVTIDERASLQGFSDLSMNGAGAIGGAVAGPILLAAGYSGLGLAAMALVTIVVLWALARRLAVRS
jgi:MFS family permease